MFTPGADSCIKDIIIAVMLSQIYTEKALELLLLLGPGRLCRPN